MSDEKPNAKNEWYVEGYDPTPEDVRRFFEWQLEMSRFMSSPSFETTNRMYELALRHLPR